MHVPLFRKADEGFVNVFQRTVQDEYGNANYHGCFAFVDRIIEKALSYNPAYLEDMGLELPNRIQQQLHEVQVPLDFPILGRVLGTGEFQFDPIFCDIGIFLEEEYWERTTVGQLLERNKRYYKQLHSLIEQHRYPLSKPIAHFAEYLLWEVIVDAELVKPYLLDQKSPAFN